jgi:hypothetical protein
MDKVELLHSLIKEESRIYKDIYKMASELKIRSIQLAEETKVSAHNRRRIIEKEQDILIKYHLNFFEHVCLMINEGFLDGNLAMKYFRDLIRDSYKEYGDKNLVGYTEIHKVLDDYGIKKELKEIKEKETKEALDRIEKMKAKK